LDPHAVQARLAIKQTMRPQLTSQTELRPTYALRGANSASVDHVQYIVNRISGAVSDAKTKLFLKRKIPAMKIYTIYVSVHRLSEIEPDRPGK
jgi:hypothetical protein